jgi:hypothetical protein
MHITYGMGLLILMTLGGFVVGCNFGVVLGGILASRKQADRNEMIVLARLHEISQGGPQLVA